MRKVAVSSAKLSRNANKIVRQIADMISPDTADMNIHLPSSSIGPLKVCCEGCWCVSVLRSCGNNDSMHYDSIDLRVVQKNQTISFCWLSLVSIPTFIMELIKAVALFCSRNSNNSALCARMNFFIIRPRWVSLGKATGFSNGTISLWEGAKRMPSAANVFELARFFGVSMDYLTGLVDS